MEWGIRFYLLIAIAVLLIYSFFAPSLQISLSPSGVTAFIDSSADSKEASKVYIPLDCIVDPLPGVNYPFNCPDGSSPCSQSGYCVKDSCFDGATLDPKYCGSCGVVCSSTQTCAKDGSGLYSCQCSDGGLYCAGRCANIQKETENCGSCGKRCTSGASCVDGACTCPTSGDTHCSVPSPGGLPDSTYCANLQKDRYNCGACGKSCSLVQSCVDGTCQCPIGKTYCGQNCVDLQTDSGNCGACGNHCSIGRICRKGRCEVHSI